MDFLSILGIVVKVVLALGVVWIGAVILEALAGSALARSAKRQQAEWDSPAGQAAVKASHDAWLTAQAAQAAVEARKPREQRKAELLTRQAAERLEREYGHHGWHRY